MYGGSGDVLSLEAVGDGAVSVPRPGPQHDQRRLRFLHVLDTANPDHCTPVYSLRPTGH